ncbi:MAG: metalloregulator ArsR/SmtB family transcription factor [Gordonia paraffinivorans]
MSSTDALDLVYAALADPTRRDIVIRLSRGDATVTELAEPHDLTFQAISQHIKVLEAGGLVSRSRVGRTRPCHLEATPLGEAISWLEDARQVWTERLDRLETYLDASQGERDV